jgi:hypothetical protein
VDVLISSQWKEDGYGPPLPSRVPEAVASRDGAGTVRWCFEDNGAAKER